MHTFTMRLLVSILALLDILLATPAAAAPCTYVTGHTGVQQDVCLNITDALQFIDQDNVQLTFDPGLHILRNTSTVVIRGFVGIVFQGLASNVRLNCEDNIGLVFLRSNQLTIQNLTITGCSIRTDQLAAVKEHAEMIFKQVVKIPNGLNVGLLIADSFNVKIENVVISGINGIGLVGLNLLGDTRISGVNFTFNKPITMSCPPLDIYSDIINTDSIAGGMFLLYQDYQLPNQSDTYNLRIQNILTIQNCRFLDNEDCSDVWVPEIFSDRTGQLDYSFGGGGGMTLMNAQTHYSVRSLIQDSNFKSNIAKFGSGAHIGFFTGSGNSTVTFNNCTFLNNGNVEEYYSGGGIAVLVDLIRPNGIRSDKRSLTDPLLTVTNTDFDGNSAFYGGGLYIYTLTGSSDIEVPTSFKIDGCNFRENRAPTASAALVFNREGSIFNALSQTEISDSCFDNNDATFGKKNIIVGVTLLTRGGQVVLRGNTIFNGNLGSALTSSRTNIIIDGDITIANTTGFAGSLRLTDLSKLILKNNSLLTFTGNAAAIYGGAIYEGSQGSHLRYTQQGCFLYFEQVNTLPQIETCPDFASLNVTMVFHENLAILGTNIYGSSLENCNWVSCLRSITGNSNLTIMEALERINIASVTRTQNETQNESLEVSTLPSRIEIFNYTEEYVMPGQQFLVNVLVYDDLDQSISSGLGSTIRKKDMIVSENKAFSRLGSNGFQFVDRSSDTTVSRIPVTVTGNPNQKLTVFVGSTDEGSTAVGSFNVTLTNCLKGFRYDTDKQSCVCETLFAKAGVQCRAESGIITLPDRVWVGQVKEGNNSLLGFTYFCPLNYCKLGTLNITKENFNYRCGDSLNREGVNCGQCRANFSSTFGSNQCLECSNDYLFLIFFFIFAGLWTMFAMAFFQITITEGYLNGVLFYSNVISLFNIFPNILAGAAFVPLSLFSQNIGFQTCFFNGMTTLGAYGLRFAYIAYLLILMVLVSLLSRFVQVPRSFTYSPTKVFATLLLLCYTSLLETCVSIFSVQVVIIDNNQSSLNRYRWYFDANVVYLEGVHGFLFALAIVTMAVYVIPFPIVILSPKLILRSKIFARLKPLLDPFWAPLKPGYEWWVAFRLIFRWIPVFLSSFVPAPLNFFILDLCLICLLFMQTKLQPFSGSHRNLFDDLLLTNLVLILTGIIYFFVVNDFVGLTVYSSVLLSLAYAVFLVILIFQIDQSYPSIRKRLLKWLKKKRAPAPEVSESRDESPPSNENVTHSEVVVSPRRNTKESFRFASRDANEILCDRRFVRYRESLLGDEKEANKGFMSTIKSRIETSI